MSSFDKPLRSIVPTAPIQGQRIGDDYHISLGGKQPVWGLLLSSLVGNFGGVQRTAWRWQQVVPSTGGTFVILGDGLSGDENTTPAFEGDGNFYAPSQTLKAKVGDVAKLWPSVGPTANSDFHYEFEYFFTDIVSANPPLTVEDSQTPQGVASPVSKIKFGDTGGNKAFSVTQNGTEADVTLNVNPNCFGSGSALTIGTTPITGGSTGNLLIDSGGTLTEISPAGVGIAAGGSPTGFVI